MAKSDTPSNRLKQELSRIERSNLPDDDKEKIVELLERIDKATKTKVNYGRSLRLFGVWVDGSLTDYTADELAVELRNMADKREWSSSTLAGYQSALKLFADFIGLEAENVEVVSAAADSALDPRDILTDDEFHALRDAAPNMRDRCLIDLLGYTGQRLRVVQTLKLKDVDLEEGVWYMPDAEGLKGADLTGKKRPLLGAHRSVREWKDMHPTGERDDYLITSQQSASNAEAGTMMAQRSIQERLKLIADRAGVDKPVNPHAFRHRFVTICKTQYDMDDGTVKHLIGHGEGSKVMETTYRHLSDDDHIAQAREAFGVDSDDEDDAVSLTPPVCPTCRRPLKRGIEECPTPTCGETFRPGDEPTTSPRMDPDEAIHESYRSAESMDKVEKLQMLDDLLDDPDVRELIDERDG